MDHYEVHLQPIPGTMLDNVFIFNMKNRIGSYLTFDVDGTPVAHSIDREDEGSVNAIKPAFRIRHDLAIQLAVGFAGVLKENGIKSADASYAEGELAATKKHLEDMRELVFPVRIEGKPITPETGS